MNELALFAGAGGGILAGQLLGWETVCAVEVESYCASVLAQRQNDGLLPVFPIWDDVCSFDGKPWRGVIDVISGGFPCQDISSAGKGAGINGERSGLWKEFARIISEVRPRYAFIENSPMLTIRGLDTVLCDLAKMGFDARWCVLGASEVGAPHKRERIWIVATRTSGKEKPLAHTSSIRQPGPGRPGNEVHTKQDKKREAGNPISNPGWQFEPAVGRVANGVAARMDRLKAIGNGQVPQCAAEAWRILTEG